MSHNAFNSLRSFDLGDGKQGEIYSLPALAEAGLGDVSRLPVCIRLILESVLRNCDGQKVTEENIRQLAGWQANAQRTEEIPFSVARIVLQDFTGVPLLVDLAAMRSAAARLGKDPKIIEPLVPVDLVVDHSVQVDFAGSNDAMDKNLDLEFTRNRERYQFLKWGMQAFNTFKVVPPGIGIVHQVNLEYLARGVLSNADSVYYPDTLVGTDSHTTMINGLGIVGWGVGGIEAEAGMLGQPVYFLTPDVVGVRLEGALREGVTATDLALTVTEMLREAKVVGKFVEFYGEGAKQLPLTDRATIANMAPEYGATMGFFPIDGETVNYLRSTGRAVRSSSRKTAGHTHSFQTLFCTHSRKLIQVSPRTSSEKKASSVAVPLAYAFSQNMSVLPRSGRGLPKRLCRLQAPPPPVKTRLNSRGTSASSGSVTSDEMRQTSRRNGHVVEASDVPGLAEQEPTSPEEKTGDLRCEADGSDPRRVATAGGNAGSHQPMQKPKQWSRHEAQQRNAISSAVLHRHAHHLRQCEPHTKRPQITIEAPTCQDTGLCPSAAEIK